MTLPLHADAQSRDEEARRLYEAGEIAFGDGRYETALERFRESHELSGRAELLYNVALCFDRLRRDDEAIAAYEEFVDAVPDSEYRREVETRVRAMRDARLQNGRTPSTSPVSSGDVSQYWWAFALGGLLVAAAVVVPVVVVTQSGTEPPLPGSFGDGSVIIALEIRP